MATPNQDSSLQDFLDSYRLGPMFRVGEYVGFDHRRRDGTSFYSPGWKILKLELDVEGRSYSYALQRYKWFEGFLPNGFYDYENGGWRKVKHEVDAASGQTFSLLCRNIDGMWEEHLSIDRSTYSLLGWSCPSPNKKLARTREFLAPVPQKQEDESSETGSSKSVKLATSLAHTSISNYDDTAMSTETEDNDGIMTPSTYDFEDA